MATASTPDTARRSYVVPGFLVLAAIWGSSFLFIKVGVRELHPVYVTVGRLALGAAVMLLLLVVMRDRLPRSPRVWAHLAVVGTIGAAIPYTLFGYGEQRISSLLAGIWNATTPLVALPLAVLLFRTERFTVRKAIGIGVGFAGVLVVLGVWQGVGGTELTGQLICLAAAACYGVAIPYFKRFLSGEPISGAALVAGQLVAGTVVLAAAAPFIAGAPPAPASLSGDVVASVLTLGVVGTGFAFLLHFRNIRLVGASASSLVTYLIPVFAVLVGVVVLNESLTWFQPVGTLIVLSGIAISQGLPIRLRRRVRHVQLATVGAPPG
jgi:drug/metabolite transporter (DMT)-like permease